jgi:hypothetical protein
LPVGKHELFYLVSIGLHNAVLLMEGMLAHEFLLIAQLLLELSDAVHQLVVKLHVAI